MSDPQISVSHEDRRRLNAIMAAAYAKTKGSNASNTLTGANRYVGRKTFAATLSQRDREVSSGPAKGLHETAPPSTAYSPNHKAKSSPETSSHAWSGSLKQTAERAINAPAYRQPPLGKSNRSSPIKPKSEVHAEGVEEVDEFGLLTGKILASRRSNSAMDFAADQKKKLKGIVDARRAGTPGPGAYTPKIEVTSAITNPMPSITPCNVTMASSALHSRYGFSSSPFAGPYTSASSVFSAGGLNTALASETGGFANSQGLAGNASNAEHRPSESQAPLYTLISSDNHISKQAYVALIQTKRGMEALYKYLMAEDLSQEELGVVMIRVVTAELKREVAENNRRRALKLAANAGNTTATSSTTKRSPSPAIQNSSSHYATSASALAGLIGTNTAEGLIRNAKHRGALSEEGDRLLQAMFPEQSMSSIAKKIVAQPTALPDDPQRPPSTAQPTATNSPGSQSLAPMSGNVTRTTSMAKGHGIAQGNSGNILSSKAPKSHAAKYTEGDEEDLQWTFTVDSHYNVVLTDKEGNIKPHPSTLRKAMRDTLAVANLGSSAKGISNPEAITPAVVNKLSYRHPIFATERIQMLAHVAVLAGMAKGNQRQQRAEHRDIGPIADQIMSLLPIPLSAQHRAAQEDAEVSRQGRQALSRGRSRSLTTATNEASALLRSLHTNKGNQAHALAPTEDSQSTVLNLSAITGTQDRPPSSTKVASIGLVGTGSRFIWDPPSMADSRKGGVIPRAGRGDHEEKVTALRNELVQNLKIKEKERRKLEELGDERRMANSLRGGSERGSDMGDHNSEAGEGQISPRKNSSLTNHVEDYAPYSEVYPVQGASGLLRFRGGPEESDGLRGRNSGPHPTNGLTVGCNYLGTTRPVQTQYDVQPVGVSMPKDSQGRPLPTASPGYRGFYTVEYPPLPPSLRPLGGDAVEKKVGDATGGDEPVGIEITDRFVGNDPAKFNHTMHISTHFSYVETPTSKLEGYQRKLRQRELERQQMEKMRVMEEQRLAVRLGQGAQSPLRRLMSHPAYQDSSSDEDDELTSAVMARHFTSHSYHISDSPPCLNTKGAFSRSGGATSSAALGQMGEARRGTPSINSKLAAIPHDAIAPLTEDQRNSRYMALLKQERGANISAASVLPQQLRPDDSGFRYDEQLRNPGNLTDHRLAKLHRQRDRLMEGTDVKQRGASASPGAILIKQFGGIQYRDEKHRQSRNRQPDDPLPPALAHSPPKTTLITSLFGGPKDLADDADIIAKTNALLGRR